MLALAARHTRPDLHLGGFALNELDRAPGCPAIYIVIHRRGKPRWIPVQADALTPRPSVISLRRTASWSRCAAGPPPVRQARRRRASLRSR
jgi:hypothetical protein